jgi:hypothetical protein
MNKLTKHLMIGLFALTVGISSCGEDNDGVGSRACTDASTDYSAAASAFLADLENETKCEAFKAAWLELLDKCDGRNYFDNADAYQEALDYVESFDCNAL